MAGSLGVVGSVVGISSGLNSLFGGGSSGNAKTGSSTLADPFANYRPAFAQQLYNLYQNPSSITTTPGYQFGLQSGMNTLQANQAKQGNLVSGGALQQAQQYGQQYGLQQFSNMASQLGMLAGATQSPSAGQTAASNIASANLANQLGSTNTVLSGLGSLYNQLGSSGASTPNYSYGNTFGASGSGDVLPGTDYSFG
jgi:hypothetical protein